SPRGESPSARPWFPPSSVSLGGVFWESLAQVGSRGKLCHHRRMALTAEIVKAKARELGADGVGIADASVLDAHPPDPPHPQTPSRVSPEIRSCVAFFKRIPAGDVLARGVASLHSVN